MTLQNARIALGVLVGLGAFATNARADTRDPATPAAENSPATEPSPTTRSAVAPPHRKIWYGGEILAVDVASFTLPFAGVMAQDNSATSALLAVGLAGFLFGGPIVHAAYGRPAAIVAGSFALRLGVPLITSLIGVAFGESEAARCRTEPHPLAFCGLDTLGFGVLGMLVGIVAASIIDVSELARKVEKDEARAAAKGPSPRWVPFFAIAHDHERRYVPTAGVAVSM